ncbi:MAG: hypothetical protein ACYSWO_12695 [Planctomycetota bacterium]|jgi:hypothetical protein
MTPKRIGRGILFTVLIVIFAFVHGCCDPIQRKQAYDPERRGTGRRYVQTAGVTVPE